MARTVKCGRRRTGRLAWTHLCGAVDIDVGVGVVATAVDAVGLSGSPAGYPD
jgi:hypothetical protein